MTNGKYYLCARTVAVVAVSMGFGSIRANAAWWNQGPGGAVNTPIVDGGDAPCQQCQQGQAAAGNQANPGAAAGSNFGGFNVSNFFNVNNNGAQPPQQQQQPVATAATCTAAQQAATTAALANATPNMDCTLIVPNNPLSANGLATPWILQATDPANGPCNEINPNQGAFVEATIYDPATNSISVYHPLVIDAGTQPLVTPVVPKIPLGAVVGIWIGSNATFNRLQGASATTLQNANCVNGLNGDDFGQVSACNAIAFFFVTKAAIGVGALKPPALGVATTDGLTCPTVRDFTIVDQDQSDNVVTTYLSDACGNTAQNNPANTTALTGANLLANASDNRLITKVLPAIGCSDWQTSDLTDPSGATQVASQAMHELRANTFQAAPIALVPLGDPMTLLGGEPNNQNGVPSNQKNSLYRRIVGQPPNVNTGDSRYCTDLLSVGAVRLANPANAKALSAAGSPVPAVANTLYNFLGSRFSATFSAPAAGAGLGPVGCTTLINQPDPVTLTTDANGVVTAVQFTLPNPLPAVIP